MPNPQRESRIEMKDDASDRARPCYPPLRSEARASECRNAAQAWRTPSEHKTPLRKTAQDRNRIQEAMKQNTAAAAMHPKSHPVSRTATCVALANRLFDTSDILEGRAFSGGIGSKLQPSLLALTSHDLLPYNRSFGSYRNIFLANPGQVKVIKFHGQSFFGAEARPSD